MFEYTKDDENFVCAEAGIESPIIAICYDSKASAIHCHGAPADVMIRYEILKKNFSDYGLVSTIEYIEHDDWDLDELNKIIGIADYINRYVEKMKSMKLKEMRERTGLPFLKCREYLTATHWNMHKAITAAHESMPTW